VNNLFVLLLFIADAAAVTLALWLSFLIRYRSGMFENPLQVEMDGAIAGVLIAFWGLLLAVRGAYRTPIALSRFDEAARVFKSVIWGVFIIFILTFDAEAPFRLSRLFLINYGLMVLIFLTWERISLRTLQRRLRHRGRGLWRAVIVGTGRVATQLYDQLVDYPVWGFKIIGSIQLKSADSSPPKDTVLGAVEELPDIIRHHQIQWVLIAGETDSQEDELRVLDRCSDLRVRFLAVMDYYQMVTGLVHTVEIHGLPLVEIAPQTTPLLLRIIKRGGDIAASIIMLLILAIITPILTVLIKLDSSGPVFYRQRRIGRRGREFVLYKFRSMVQDAEKMTGAVWAKKNDPRVTRIGRLLRAVHIDEIPQFINVLKGDMSLVGPRPERKTFVEQFKKKIPLYERRLRIRPGITGWAQVRHKYDETLDDVREKTRYDLFYIDHLSLSLDLKILLATALKVLRGEGH